MSSLTIGKKLFLSVGAMFLLTLALGLAAFLGINSIGTRLHTAVGPTAKKQALSSKLVLTSDEVLSDERAALIRGFVKQLDKAEAFNGSANASLDDLQKATQELLAISTRPQAIQSIQEFSATIPAMREGSKAIMEAVKAGDMEKAFNTFDTALLPISKKQHEIVDHLEELEKELAQSDAAAAESSVTTSEWITGLVLVLSLLVATLAVLVVRSVNTFLRTIMHDLGSASGQIASAATQVSGASQEIAQGASEQAATVEETSSASSEINSMAQRNMENARSASDVVKQSQERVGNTGRSLEEMVVAMDGITSSSQKISKIIKVIDEIAFQTNILALNAAVEAARAGDAGMGFAVVADEVRNLAQRSAQAAKDTTDLIEESIQQSSGGKAKVDQVAAEFKAIADESLKMKVLIDEISLGSVEQSRGIDQISTSISQIEQAVQSSAASAEETASAAEELQSQSQSMLEVVDTLARMVDGSSVSHSGAAGRPAPARSIGKTRLRTAAAHAA